jgi:hypothetical protein
MTIAINNTYIHGSSGGGLAKVVGVFSTRTLPQRVADIGSTVATLEVHTAEPIDSSLSVPSTITIKMMPGSKLTLRNAGTIVDFNGPVICEHRDHFAIGTGTELIFNHRFDAPPDLQFTCAGTGIVSFGRSKTELISALAGTGWTVSGLGATHTTGTTALTATATVVGGTRYICRYDITGGDSYVNTVRMSAGSVYDGTMTNDGKNYCNRSAYA